MDCVAVRDGVKFRPRLHCEPVYAENTSRFGWPVLSTLLVHISSFPGWFPGTVETISHHHGRVTTDKKRIRSGSWVFLRACHRSWSVPANMTLDRKDRELIRKRRKNLIRRHDDFRRRYGMKIWLTMEMPSGRLYTYQSHPYLPAPTELEISMHQPAAMRMTPSDFEDPSQIESEPLGSRQDDDRESDSCHQSLVAKGKPLRQFPALRLSRAAR